MSTTERVEQLMSAIAATDRLIELGREAAEARRVLRRVLSALLDASTPSIDLRCAWREDATSCSPRGERRRDLCLKHYRLTQRRRLLDRYPERGAFVPRRRLDN